MHSFPCLTRCLPWSSAADTLQLQPLQHRKARFCLTHSHPCLRFLQSSGIQVATLQGSLPRNCVGEWLTFPLCLSLPGQMPEPLSSGGSSPWMGRSPSPAQQVVWELHDHRCLQCSVPDKQISWQLQAVLEPLFSEMKDGQVLNPWVCGGGYEAEGCHHPYCGQDTITTPSLQAATMSRSALGAHRQAWQLEFSSWDPCSGRTTSCKSPSDFCMCTTMCARTHKSNRKDVLKLKKIKGVTS